MMKKTVSLFLVMVMILGIIVIAPTTVSAQTGGHTQADAVAWAQAQVGKSLDYDGAYGAQCVDLIAFYYQYLGNTTPGGNARDYCSNALPAGWQRITNYNGFVPQAGDICVWGAKAGGNGSYGHVAIFINGDSSRINTIDQNYLGNMKTDYHSWATSQVTCFIRPDFAPPGNNPQGSVDAVEGGNGTVHVSGWAFDRDDMSKYLTIHIFIGGESDQAGGEGYEISEAKVTRVDVHEKYGCGWDHGFDTILKTNKRGIQPVYVYAINIGAGTNILIDVKEVVITDENPIGSLDTLEGGIGEISLTGWAFDYDDASKYLSVKVYIGGDSTETQAQLYTILEAKETRVDVHEKYRCGWDHGYKTIIKTNKSGTQPVYVYAVNIGNGKDILIGKGEVYITSNNPKGSVDTLTGGKGEFNINDWAFDYNDMSKYLTVKVYIGSDSVNTGAEVYTIPEAKITRIDVHEKYGCGWDHGYDVTIKTQKIGLQPIYVYAINIGDGTDTLIGKGEVNIDKNEEIVSNPTQPTTVEPTEPTSTEPTQSTTVKPTETTEPTEPTTVKPTQPTTVKPTEPTEPTQAPETIVKGGKYKSLLYVKGCTYIKPNIINPKGKTTFKSDSPNIARVYSNGKVVALKKGIAWITVENNNAGTMFMIEVRNPSLNKNSVTLYRGQNTTLKIKGKIGKARFYSSNTRVAKVNKSGKITARKKGKAKITVLANGVTLKCKVKVK